MTVIIIVVVSYLRRQRKIPNINSEKYRSTNIILKVEGVVGKYLDSINKFALSSQQLLLPIAMLAVMSMNC